MKDLGITSGCSFTQYCPDDPNTRGQISVFLARGLFVLWNDRSPQSQPPWSVVHSYLNVSTRAVHQLNLSQWANVQLQRFTDTCVRSSYFDMNLPPTGGQWIRVGQITIEFKHLPLHPSPQAAGESLVPFQEMLARLPAPHSQMFGKNMDWKTVAVLPPV